jgi:UDP-N-acetylmuramoylalanine--D-glutamate ligase
LDRHGSIRAYQSIKRRLAELAPADGFIVLNADDPVSSGFGSISSARPVLYSRRQPPAGGVGIFDGWIVADGDDRRVMPIDEIRLRGQHNVSNVLAAVAVGRIFGIAPEPIRQAIADFEGLQDRLEPVLRLNDVLFVNDTQATQPDATIAGLHSFAPPIVLICGGTDKRLPMDRLAVEAASAASAVVVMGETGPQLAEMIRAAGGLHVEEQPDMEPAVRRAFALAREALAATDATAASEATVLLSPAAAGYDLLSPYSVRGAEFKQAVLRLAGSLGAAAGTDESAGERSARRRPAAAPARREG